jgi:hypothetical protein
VPSDLEPVGAVGTAVHTLIALLAAKGGSAPSVSEVREAGRAFVGKGRSPSSRQALRCAVTTLSAVYVRQFWPEGGRLIASERVIGEAALDLLWQLPDGGLQIDEVKTGILAGTEHEPTVSQAVTQAVEGRRHLGSAFIGVRVVVLRRPQQSFFVRADQAGYGPAQTERRSASDRR